MSSEPALLLIVGASGYLGGRLAARAGPAWRLAGTYLTAAPPAGLDAYPLDVRDAAAVSALLARLRPRAVLHVAYRRDDPAVNVAGTRHVAAACARVGARLVFVSTDLVFDGRRGRYREVDPPSPIEPYGAAKATAEQEVLRRGGVVARTSLIYGFDPPDPTTRRLIAEPLRRGERPRLFVDEFRCPVYADDLADALLELTGNDYRGVLHVSGPQRLSRYDFGVRLAKVLAVDSSRLEPARQADSGLVRPADCSLDVSLARQVLRTRLRSVDEAITDHQSRPVGG